MPQLCASQCCCTKTKQETTQVPAAPRVHQGLTIGQDTILQLLKQVPETVEKATSEWFKKNPEIANAALGYEPFIRTNLTLSNGKTVIDKTNELLTQQGTPNKSPFNYVFQHPTLKGYVIKIAGHANRKYNISHQLQWDEKTQGWTKGYNYQKALTQEDYDRLAKELDAKHFDHMTQTSGQQILITTAPKTYQHVSRAAHYLLLREAIEQGKLTHITAPQMWLVHIPGRSTEVSDRNYVIVEEELKGLKDIDSLSSTEAAELEEAIRATGLFNINKENCKRTAEGKIVILDFEQPNNSIPTQFFHLNKTRYENNVRAGLQSFKESMKPELQALQNRQDIQEEVVKYLQPINDSNDPTSIVMQCLFGVSKA